ncbi:alpha/beta hydrolase [Mesorhizobium sp.]|uniref:alpha/beta fold hydrolase n=1 Tax=Mesorhizobium sp. TaxID=1871066 RepID=UPI00120E96F3|nr:alpha/beta hydrolase [Mesorhizobium sp.]TIL44419.1 MAG: alpha/beta hydrolase [Mesorhizobium sp.]
MQPTLLAEYLTPRVFHVSMSEGRTVRGYEIGPLDVPLVVGIHGTPSTGLGHIVNYAASGAFFCRLVTFDRQGYGGSTPTPGRKVHDIVPVVDAILDHLSVGSAAIYGHSGGGLLALATAALLPKRISKAACVVGNGPSFGPGGFDYTQGSSPLMCEEMIEARKGPEASRDCYKRIPARLNDPEFEKQVWSDNDIRIRRLLASLREKIEQELALPESPHSEEDAYVDDIQSWLAPLGFEFGSITVPTRIFHGSKDLMVAQHHSEWLQTQIPNASLKVFRHYGHHLSAFLPHVLEWLVSESLTMESSRQFIRCGGDKAY